MSLYKKVFYFMLFFILVACNFVMEKEWTNPVDPGRYDKIPPSEITNLEITPGNGQLSLRWTNPEDVDFQKVEIWYGKDAPETFFEGLIDNNNTVINDLDDNCNYIVKIISFDTVNNRSKGVITKVSTRNSLAPNEISSLIATPGENKISLEWINPTDSDFDRVELYYGKSNADIKYTGIINEQETVIDNLDSDQSYIIKVITVDTEGNKSSGKIITSNTVDNVSPNEISNLLKNSTEDSISLSWDNPTDSDFKSVKIYYGKDDSNQLLSGTYFNEVTIENLTSNSTYIIKITTIDQLGNESEGSIFNISTSDPLAPGNVLSLSCMSGERSLTLSWEDPNDDNFNNVEIWYGVGSADNKFTGFINNSGTSITSLRDNTTYVIKVLSVGKNGVNSNGVEIIKSTNNTVSPNPVMGLEGTASRNSIDLKWGIPNDHDLQNIKIKYGFNSYYEEKTVDKGTSSIIITGLIENKEYEIFVSCIDTGSLSSIEQRITLKTLDKTPPGEVSNISAVPYSSYITLSWNNPPDSDHSKTEIFYGESEKNNSLDISSNNNSINIPNLDPGTTYSFTIYTVDSSGNKSSGVDFYRSTNTLNAPGNVINLTTEPGDKSIKLTWQNPDDENFKEVKIYYGKGNTNTEFQGVINNINTTISGLDDNELYDIKIISIGKNGFNSAGVDRNEKTNNTLKPGSINNLTSLSGDNNINLSWDTPTDHDFDHVFIKCNTLPNIKEFRVPKDQSSLNLTGLPHTTTYQFEISVVDNGGLSSNKEFLNVSTNDKTAPGEVLITDKVATLNNITLKWTNPIDSDFNKVKIYYGEVSATTLFTGVCNPLGTTVANLQSDKNYKFKVVTVDITGNESNGISFSVNTLPAPAPANVTNLSGVSGNNQIELSWINPDDINFKEVKIYYGIGNVDTLWGTFTSNNTTINNLIDNTQYSFKVVSIGKNGFDSSGEPISVKTNNTVSPGSINNLSTISGDDRITIEWGTPIDHDFDHVFIKCNTLPTTKEFIVPKDRSYLTITGLPHTTTYQFEISVVDNGGLSSNKEFLTVSTNDKTAPGEVIITDKVAALNDITLKWTNPIDSDFNKVKIYYGLVSARTLFTGVINPLGTTITNLQPNTEYKFKIVTIDNLDNESNGNSFTVNTLSAPAPDNITSLSGIPGTNQIRLTWVNPNNFYFKEVAVYYGIGNTDTLWGTYTTNNVTITDLEDNVEYSFKVVSIGNNGLTSSGETGRYKTKNTVYPDPVTSLNARGGDKVIDLTWVVSSSHDLKHYLITYSDSSTVESKTVTGNSTRLTGLLENTQYEINIYAVDTGDLKSIKSTKTVKTLDVTAPIEVHITGSTRVSGGYDIGWEFRGSETDFKNVKVSYSDDNGSSFTFVRTTTTSPFNIPLALDGVYKIKIQSVDESGNESPGRIIDVDTLPPKIKLENFRVEKNHLNKIELKWDIPADIDFEKVQIEYGIDYYNTNSITLTKDEVNLKSYTLTDLVGYKSYNISYSHINIYGQISSRSYIYTATFNTKSTYDDGSSDYFGIYNPISIYVVPTNNSLIFNYSFGTNYNSSHRISYKNENNTTRTIYSTVRNPDLDKYIFECIEFENSKYVEADTQYSCSFMNTYTKYGDIYQGNSIKLNVKTYKD